MFAKATLSFFAGSLGGAVLQHVHRKRTLKNSSIETDETPKCITTTKVDPIEYAKLMLKYDEARAEYFRIKGDKAYEETHTDIHEWENNRYT